MKLTGDVILMSEVKGKKQLCFYNKKLFVISNEIKRGGTTMFHE